MPISSGKIYRERQTVAGRVVRRLTIRTRQCLIYKEIARWAVRRALVTPGKEMVLAPERHGADRAFDRIGIEFNAAVMQESGQTFPARERIADRLGQGAPARYARKLGFQP